MAFDASGPRTVVTVLVNGECDASRGKKMNMSIDWTFPQFLQRAAELLEMGHASRAFTEVGVEIDDCMMIEDNSLLYLSDGGPFVPVDDDDGAVGATSGGGGGGGGSGSPLPSSVGLYAVHEELGVGGFGCVMRGSCNRVQVALKFIRKKLVQHNLKTAEMLNSEIKCLALLKHRNILQLHDRLETAKHIVLAVDLMVGGDGTSSILLKYPHTVSASHRALYLLLHLLAVLEHMKSRGTSAADIALDDEAARHIIKQVLSGVTYMHQRNVIHRDLKLENLLLCGTAAQLVKISDFGLAEHLMSPTAKVRDCNGTTAYLAPEMFVSGATFLGPPLDYWALGNILFAMVCGRLPFAGVSTLSAPFAEWPTDAAIERNICDGTYVYESFACPGARAVCNILLDRDPDKRFLAHHPWVSGGDYVLDGDDGAAAAVGASVTASAEDASGITSKDGSSNTGESPNGAGGSNREKVDRVGRSSTTMDRYVEAAVSRVTAIVRGLPFTSSSSKDNFSGLDPLSRSSHGSTRPDSERDRGELTSKSMHGGQQVAGVAFGRGSRNKLPPKPANPFDEALRDLQEAEARINQALTRGTAGGGGGGGGSVRMRAGSIKDDLDRSRNVGRDPLAGSRHGKDPLSSSRHGEPVSGRHRSFDGLHDELDKSIHEHARSGSIRSGGGGGGGGGGGSVRKAPQSQVELVDELDKSLHSLPRTVTRTPSQMSLGTAGSNSSSHVSSYSSLSRAGNRSLNAPTGDYDDDEEGSPTTFGFRSATAKNTSVRATSARHSGRS